MVNLDIFHWQIGSTDTVFRAACAKNERYIHTRLRMHARRLQRLPTWLAIIIQIALAGFVLLALISILIYAPFWTIIGPLMKRHHHKERFIRLWPLIASISVVAMITIFNLAMEDVITRLGSVTVWSLAFLLSTVLFGAATIASVIALWYVPKRVIRRPVLIYSLFSIVALLIVPHYLAYWGILGLCTWTWSTK